MSLSLTRIVAVGCLLLTGLLSGCGDDTTPAEQQAPAAEDRPDSGLDASNRLKEMQPPPPPGS